MNRKFYVRFETERDKLCDKEFNGSFVSIDNGDVVLSNCKVGWRFTHIFTEESVSPPCFHGFTKLTQYKEFSLILLRTYKEESNLSRKMGNLGCNLFLRQKWITFYSVILFMVAGINLLLSTSIQESWRKKRINYLWKKQDILKNLRWIWPTPIYHHSLFRYLICDKTWFISYVFLSGPGTSLFCRITITLSI